MPLSTLNFTTLSSACKTWCLATYAQKWRSLYCFFSLDPDKAFTALPQETFETNCYNLRAKLSSLLEFEVS